MVDRVTETVELARVRDSDHVSGVSDPKRDAVVAAECLEAGNAVFDLRHCAPLYCEAEENAESYEQTLGLCFLVGM